MRKHVYLTATGNLDVDSDQSRGAVRATPDGQQPVERDNPNERTMLGFCRHMHVMDHKVGSAFKAHDTRVLRYEGITTAFGRPDHSGAVTRWTSGIR